MFRNQNTKPKDPEARKELETEENIDNDVSGTDLFGSLLNSGNENAVKEIIGNNIIKNTEDDDDDTDLFAGFGSEDKKESKPAPKKKPVNIIQEDDDDETDLFGDFGSEDKKKSKPVPKKKPANIIQEDDDDRGNLFGDFGEEASKESDPGAAAIKNQIKKIKGVVIKENAKKAGEIKIPAKQYGLKDASKNIYPGEKPAIQEFYEDPEEEPHIDYQGEGKLNRRVHYRKPKHTDADADRSRNKKFSDWRIENAKKARKKELERINDEQKRVAGLDFTLQKLPARNKAGWFRKFLTNLAIAAGSTIGKGFNWIGAQFRRLFDSSFAANYNLAKSDKAKNPAITQKKRVHDVIPGWNGEKFQKGPNGEDNILADFRRIPTVWSTITAGQAEDKKGKPLPPKISIYVRKGGEDDKTLEGKDAGHAGLGIEYSRYSRRTNRYERYNLRYGFYPAGDEKKAAHSSVKLICPMPLRQTCGGWKGKMPAH